MLNNALLQMLPQFKANPMQILLQKRLNVPADMLGDPQRILNHLLQTGQVSQDAVNRAYQQASQYR